MHAWRGEGNNHHPPRPGGMHVRCILHQSVFVGSGKLALRACVRHSSPATIDRTRAVYYRKSHRGPCGGREQICTGTTAGAQVHNSQQDAADRCSWNLTWPIYGGPRSSLPTLGGPWTPAHLAHIRTIMRRSSAENRNRGLAQRDGKDFLFFTGAQKLYENRKKKAT